jgi:hypothetical protein
MESNEVWSEALGWSPEDTGDLSYFFGNRVQKFFEIWDLILLKLMLF